MKSSTNRRVKSGRSQSEARKDGRLFANICKGVSFIGLLVLEFLKHYQG